MKTPNTLEECHVVFTKKEKRYWTFIAWALTSLSLGLVLIKFYTPFFERERYLTLKNIYNVLKKNPNILPTPKIIKNFTGITIYYNLNNGYRFVIFGKTLKWGFFNNINCIISSYLDPNIFSSYNKYYYDIYRALLFNKSLTKERIKRNYENI